MKTYDRHYWLYDAETRRVICERCKERYGPRTYRSPCYPSLPVALSLASSQEDDPCPVETYERGME